MKQDLFFVAAMVAPTLHVIGALHAVHAIMRVPNAQGAIAWSLVLIFFPYLSVPLYLIFGPWSFRDFRKAALLAQREQLQREQSRAMLHCKKYVTCLPLSYHYFEQVLIKLAGEQFTSSNDVELIINGDLFFPRLLEEISHSSTQIFLQFFIWRNDGIGKDIFDALKAASERGVAVYLLYDPIGSFSLDNDVIEDLESEGVQIAAFHTTRGSLLKRFRLNYRNHRKIAIFDGKSALVSGFNIGDEYLGRSPRFGRWRDTGVKVIGPAVYDLERTFLLDWRYATGSSLLGRDHYSFRADSEDLELSVNNGMIVLPIATGPVGSSGDCGLLFLTAIEEAKYRIIIATPYFVPDEAVLQSLRRAVLRGIDITLILPDNWDHAVVQLASLFYAHIAIRYGCKVFRYTDGFMHQKSMLVDEEISIIGSGNWDQRSFRLNFEQHIVVFDLSFAKQVEQMLQHDISHSRQITSEEFAGRPFPIRLSAHLARLFSPIL